MSEYPPSPSAPSPTNGSPLGGQLAAECEAVKNDLEQARELASTFQAQLAEKANEAGQLKALLEQTQSKANRLDQHVQQLRRERHQLSNEAMRCDALQRKFQIAEAELQRLRAMRDLLRDKSEGVVLALKGMNADQHEEIERLRGEIFLLKFGVGGDAGAAQRQLVQLKATVAALEKDLAARRTPGAREFDGFAPEEPDVINLSSPA
jgi:predicted RNase H-like nuclease (RuvC/YqgF family)